ncbi:MAG: nuclear transport factor 2 family protein [Acidimicrobiales bacterium]
MSWTHGTSGASGMTPGRMELDRLLAYEEIRQLAARYAVAVDARDVDTLAALFVDDVRVGTAEHGRAALRHSFDASLRAIGVSILNVGTHVIDLVDEDHATVSVYCKAEIQDGRRWIHQAIVYEDRYERRAGRWQFVSRKHRLFYGAEVGVNPLGLPPANWPAHHDGWGTVPESWASWRRFWAGAGEEPGAAAHSGEQR